ncbi:MAG: hypothetical protein ABSA33_06425, partial [Candidatus Micrarchaeaceae archaeon]
MLTKDQAVDVNHALEATGGDTLSVTGAFNEVGAKAPAEVGINEDSAMIAPAIPYAVAGAISLIGGGFVAKQIASAQEPSLLERKMISSLQRLTSSWDRRRDIEFLASNGTDPRVGPALLDVVRENPNSSNCAFAVLALLELRIFNDQLFNVLTERIRKEGSKSAEDPEFKVWQTMAEIRSHLGPRSSIPQGSDRAMLNVLPTSFLRLLGDRGLDSIVDRLDSGVESIRRNAKGALLEMLRYEEDPSKRQAVMEAIDRLPPGIKSLEEKYSIYNNAVFFFAHQDVCVWAIHRIGELGRIQLEDLQLPPELKW